ncbi:hypothetical protein LP316_15600 [Thalassotalea sp. LPB0316]|uniref:hypothetical protein n=1 Tax=Thalassotalea sp. LPB0316 TaxID=2769490 RepID=UPI001868B961|nr:hypothetical protein [Thalassotalea sp. LPB0316]QOL25692.1 hypothetical protein LP316_15600 [Thalassotalea sp. LPB0316]
MKLKNSVAAYQQAYQSTHNDVTAFHATPRDVSLYDYIQALVMKFPRLVIGRAYYRFVRRFLDNKPSKDLTPETLYLLITSTGLSRYVRGNVLDLKYFANIGMQTAEIDLDTTRQVAIPRSRLGESEVETMDRAQRACFLAVPIHYHSFVHFHAPTALAIYATKVKDKKFKRFIQRHSRYTLVYNNGGIAASSSEFFCKTLLPDYANMRASDSILARVQQYWNITEQTEPNKPLASEIANPDNFAMAWQPKLTSNFCFDKKIHSFYPYIRSYVANQGFSKAQLLAFSTWFNEAIYPIPEAIRDTELPLTYLIWSNSVVHSLEHAEYYKWIDYARFGPKTHNDAWYRYFVNAYAKPYGSMFRSEKLSNFIPEIKHLAGADKCYVSIQF